MPHVALHHHVRDVQLYAQVNELVDILSAYTSLETPNGEQVNVRVRSPTGGIGDFITTTTGWVHHQHLVLIRQVHIPVERREIHLLAHNPLMLMLVQVPAVRDVGEGLRR